MIDHFPDIDDMGWRVRELFSIGVAAMVAVAALISTLWLLAGM